MKAVKRLLKGSPGNTHNAHTEIPNHAIPHTRARTRVHTHTHTQVGPTKASNSPMRAVKGLLDGSPGKKAPTPSGGSGSAPLTNFALLKHDGKVR